jgi:alkylation response protein AidB-like acyl-CoA dehydrogenase
MSEIDQPVQLGLTQDQITFGDGVRKFLAERCNDAEVRRLMLDELGYDPKVWRVASEQLGLGGLDIPEQYGGSGASLGEVAVVMEAFGESLACLPFFSTAILAAGALLAVDDEDARREYLPGLAAGDVTASLAVAEINGSSDTDVLTRAEPDGDRFLLTGVKCFVVDGCSAQLILVVARTVNGLSLFGVVGDAPGLVRTPMETLDPTRKLATLTFAQVPARLIGPDGSAPRILKRVRDRVALALAGEQLGIASRVLSMAVDYAKTRVQFGRPIGSFQAVKHRCVDMAQRIEAARSAILWATATAVTNDESAPVAVAMATVCCTDAAIFATAENIQIHGGIGFTWEHSAHLYFRRAQSTTLLHGSAEDARELLLQRLGV